MEVDNHARHSYGRLKVQTVPRTKFVTIPLSSVFAVLMIGGCSGDSSTPQSSSNDVSAISAADAPKVSQPLNVSRYLQNPCELLSSAQLASIGFTSTTAPSSQGSDAGGSQCAWNDDNTSSHIDVVWQAAYTNGLSDLYARKSSQKYFQPIQIEGYPAVLASEFDDRSDGECLANVGPTDTNMFFVRYHSFNEPQKSQACDLAQKTAGLVIDTMKNGGS